MDFPILTLLDTTASIMWLEQHFHPTGFGCPHCGAHVKEARTFRINRANCLPVYRCRNCDGIYTLYSGTIFAGAHLLPTQVVLLLRGVFQGQASAHLAREVSLTEKTVLKWRHRIQANAEAIQPDTPLPDPATESDEMFQNAGEKKRGAFRPRRPTTQPRQQAARAGYLCQ